MRALLDFEVRTWLFFIVFSFKHTNERPEWLPLDVKLHCLSLRLWEPDLSLSSRNNHLALTPELFPTNIWSQFARKSQKCFSDSFMSVGGFASEYPPTTLKGSAFHNSHPIRCLSGWKPHFLLLLPVKLCPAQGLGHHLSEPLCWWWWCGLSLTLNKGPCVFASLVVFGGLETCAHHKPVLTWSEVMLPQGKRSRNIRFGKTNCSLCGTSAGA